MASGAFLVRDVITHSMHSVLWLAGPPFGVTTDLLLRGFPVQAGQVAVQSRTLTSGFAHLINITVVNTSLIFIQELSLPLNGFSLGGGRYSC